MKSSEIRELSNQELLERIDNEKTALVRMKLNHAISPLENRRRSRKQKDNGQAHDREAQERDEREYKIVVITMEERNLRKERTGVVVSNKMDKSIVVAIHRKVKHPIYGKFVNKTKKLMAHDEENACNIGDTVRVMETGLSARINPGDWWK
jgi:small subunit ribosomal protein S17